MYENDKVSLICWSVGRGIPNTGTLLMLAPLVIVLLEVLCIPRTK